jgi:DNA invertase Pin-like site-specific DNA recombinase
MIYGYCRISTGRQKIERQIRNIAAAYPDAKIITEVFTGTKFQGRKELEKLQKQLRPGDTIVFDSVSRMSRNAEEGFALYQELFDQGIHMIFLKEPHINSDTYRQSMDSQIQIAINSGNIDVDVMLEAFIDALNKFIMALARKQIQIAFDQAEKEVLDLHQRTKEGLETARRNGKQIGRRTGQQVVTQKSMTAKTAILKYSKNFGGTMPNKDLLKIANVSMQSLLTYKQQLTEEIEASSLEEVMIRYKVVQ